MMYDQKTRTPRVFAVDTNIEWVSKPVFFANSVEVRSVGIAYYRVSITCNDIIYYHATLVLYKTEPRLLIFTIITNRL